MTEALTTNALAGYLGWDGGLGVADKCNRPVCMSDECSCSRRARSKKRLEDRRHGE